MEAAKNDEVFFLHVILTEKMESDRREEETTVGKLSVLI
jgi:hypothetical protein